MCIDFEAEHSEVVEGSLFQFRLGAEEVQNKFAKHLYFIHSCKQSVANSCRKHKKIESLKKGLKSIGKAFSRSTSGKGKEGKGKDSSKGTYIDVVKAVFEDAGRLQLWVHLLDDSQTSEELVGHWGREAVDAIHEHLRAISEFFYCVVCNIVIRDMMVLVKRHAKCIRDKNVFHDT